MKQKFNMPILTGRQALQPLVQPNRHDPSVRVVGQKPAGLVLAQRVYGRTYVIASGRPKPV